MPLEISGNLRFRVGLVTNTAVGPLIDVAAYSFAPQSLVAPFGGLVANNGKPFPGVCVVLCRSVSFCVDLCRSVSFLVSERDALRLDLIPFHTVQSHRFTESFAVCLLKELGTWEKH